MSYSNPINDLMPRRNLDQRDFLAYKASSAKGSSDIKKTTL